MQAEVWEKEYRKPKFITGYDKPQSFFLKFLKNNKFDFKNLIVLDLGSGTGRNANYLAQKGAKVFGLEISDAAIKFAKDRAKKLNIKVDYLKQNIGSAYSFKDNFFDLILDITSSNSLSEKERGIYLKEVVRVLKKDGIFLVRVLRKDGDKNVRHLLKNNPGKEKDTYIMPETQITERVFGEKDFVDLYSWYFDFIKIEKTTSYMKVGERIYKRNFLIATLKRKL